MSGSFAPYTNALTEQLANTSFQSNQSFDPSTNVYDPISSGRRGPRPTLEPAANTKRQKNREAQRAHRGRKERYVKDLEYEAARLRQYGVKVTSERDDAARQRDALYRETRELRSVIESMTPMLRPNARVPQVPQPTFVPKRPFVASSGSAYASSATMPADNWSQSSQSQLTGSFGSEASSESGFTNPGTGTLDYDAIALDFVLGLERPCMAHAQYLVTRAHEPTSHVHQSTHPEVPDDGENEEISGHAMMASCPVPSPLRLFLNNSAGSRLQQMDNADLTRLLGLSDELPGVSEAELPIIKAWTRLRSDDRFPRLSAEDFQNIQRQLLTIVQCYRYRFGSVVAADELDQAMDRVCNALGRTPSGKDS